jgi:hypothetical protein
MIDVKNGTLTLNIGDDKVRFQIDRAMKYPSSAESCFKIDVIDECLEGLAEDYLLEQTNRSLRYHLNFLSEIQVEESEAESICAADATTEALDKLSHGPHNSHTGRVNPDFGEGLGPDKANPATPHGSSVTHTDRATSQTEPTPELKPLPANLRYEYLGPNNSCPVIVNADLSPEQTAKLLEKLKIHKGAIGYSIKDLKGINPTICSHRILLEDRHKPSVEHQRRLNPNLKEVVKKVLKLLDAGIIYPISDNECVSPVHVVPKKGGTTVVKNDKDELIQTRVVTGWRMCIDYKKLNAARTYPLSDPSITDVYRLVYDMRQEQGAILRDLTDRVGAIEAELRDWHWYEYDFDPDSDHGAADH